MARNARRWKRRAYASPIRLRMSPGCSFRHKPERFKIAVLTFARSSGMSSRMLARKFSVAPMMDWTDRHCRFFHRLLTKNALLYTEMLTADAVIHGPRERLLA